MLNMIEIVISAESIVRAMAQRREIRMSGFEKADSIEQETFEDSRGRAALLTQVFGGLD